MTEIERSILAQHHKLVKLAKIWRAIARRHLSRAADLNAWQAVARSQRERLLVLSNTDGETDP